MNEELRGEISQIIYMTLLTKGDALKAADTILAIIDPEITSLRAEIERLKAELDKREWISVKDRLPVVGENCWSNIVLVNWLNTNLFRKTWRSVEKARFSGDYWECLSLDETIFFDSDDAPTHWMPLPRLPEVEK